MAVTSKGTKVSIRPSNRIPDGFIAPAVDAFQDYQKISRRSTYLISKSSVEDSDPKTTLMNIIQDNTDGLEAKIKAEIETEYDSANNTNDISFWVEMHTLDTDQNPLDPNNSDFLKDGAVDYIVEATYYIKSESA